MFVQLLGAEHVVELHAGDNPGFLGQAPEPIERNLCALAETVVQQGCAAGIANDGDADRIGMYDEEGNFVDSHRMLALLLKYLHLEQGHSGSIVKTFSTSDMLTKMGEAYGLTVHTTPIGFKYIASLILDEEVLVGGEESGGLAVRGHIPDRDGIYIGLLLLEMMVKRGKKLSELVKELYDEFGPHGYYRVDIHTTVAKKEEILRLLKEDGGLRQLNGHAVTQLESLDGFKHRIAGGWLLIRPSGTEPVLRIYAEAATTLGARALVEDAVQQLGV
jgi:phosphomannomutase